MKCHRCKLDFHDGDTAYVQIERKISVVGTRATFVDREILVCDVCAK